MKPIEIVAEMLVHALKSNAKHEEISVVFLIMSRLIEELPGDNTYLTKWMDQSMLIMSRSQKSTIA
jgi:hypothetical protein